MHSSTGLELNEKMQLMNCAGHTKYHLSPLLIFQHNKRVLIDSFVVFDLQTIDFADSVVDRYCSY